MKQIQAVLSERIAKLTYELSLLKKLFAAAPQHSWRLYVASVASVLHVACSISAVAMSAVFIDRLWVCVQAAAQEGIAYSLTLSTGGLELLYTFGLWTCSWLCYHVQVNVMASFAEALNLELRRKISAKLMHLPIAYFDAHQPGSIMSTPTTDLDKVSEVLQRGVLQLITAACNVVGALCMMLYYDAGLSLIFLVFAATAAAATFMVSRYTRSVSSARQEAFSQLSACVEEYFSGRHLIKSFNQEHTSAERVDKLSSLVQHKSQQTDFMVNAAGPIVRFIMRLCQVTTAVFAGLSLVSGAMSVGVFQAYFQYVMTASEPMTQLSFTFSLFQGAISAAERVFAFLEDEEESPDCAEESLSSVEGAIEFRDVSFAYTPEKPLLQGVNLKVLPGQKVAIVGSTGAGKTTLINLLLRFYDINAGTITLDEVDIARMSRADLRKHFGMVLQDGWLFDGTIAENIAYGNPSATRDQIESVARMAHIDHYIRSLPEGYDTHISQDSEQLSQGQRQLLTIARAMLCDPSILILDEATSNVDTQTEQAIVKAMQALVKGRTSFVIAHRLSTILDADMIVVMAQGTIQEMGNHEELLAHGGMYAQLYKSQFASQTIL